MKIIKRALMVTVLLFGCERKYQESDLLEIVTCADCYCATVVYQISISLHNFKIVAPTMSYSKDEIIKYCLHTDPSCGGYIYYSLANLLRQDSSKFSYLMERYALSDIDSFVSIMTEPSSDYEQKNSNLITELKQLCDCK